ncbi:MAG: hypothetical protein HQ511_10140 [Rhodospirillales bacterium]|nr:hypothetical protein [Rhodospirillales bacterium]
MLEIVLKIIVWIGTPLAAFLAVNFIGKVIVGFHTLRREILAELGATANVSHREGNETRWDEAQAKLRSLGTGLRAMHDTSNKIVRLYFHLYGYNLSEASSGLIGLSNSLATLGYQRAAARYRIEKGLKFPHATSIEMIEKLRERELRIGR